jgi:hypothetical protein
LTYLNVQIHVKTPSLGGFHVYVPLEPNAYPSGGVGSPDYTLKKSWEWTGPAFYTETILLKLKAGGDSSQDSFATLNGQPFDGS